MIGACSCEKSLDFFLASKLNQVAVTDECCEWHLISNKYKSSKPFINGPATLFLKDGMTLDIKNMWYLKLKQ